LQNTAFFQGNSKKQQTIQPGTENTLYKTKQPPKNSNFVKYGLEAFLAIQKNITVLTNLPNKFRVKISFYDY
jgi:hypothetical protein